MVNTEHKPHAALLDLRSIDRDDLDLSPLNNLALDWHLFAGTSPDQLLNRLQRTEVVVTNKVILDRTALLQNPQLKHICIAATGTNNVDLEAARELGIGVSNETGYATPAVVQHVFSLILALYTRLLDYRQAVNTGAWQKSDQFCLLDFPIREISGKHLGIVGLGELGRGVADVAKAFGAKVSIARRPGADQTGQKERRPLQALLPEVDILSLHCPLTDATRNLIGEQELALMKPDALLINTARGGIVDEAALAKALRVGRLGGAGVDVLACEPPREGNPLLAPDIPNLIVTPHTAWASRESRQRLIEGVALNIDAYLSGRVANRVV